MKQIELVSSLGDVAWVGSGVRGRVRGVEPVEEEISKDKGPEEE